MAKALLPTVVEIRHGSGVGSGFVYDENGYIMTAAQVIEAVTRSRSASTTAPGCRARSSAPTPNDVGVVKVDRTGLKAALLGVGYVTSRSASSPSPSAAPSASTRP